MTGPCNIEGCDCGHLVQELEEQKRNLKAQLEAFVELAEQWFTDGLPEDWAGRCVCANAAIAVCD